MDTATLAKYGIVIDPTNLPKALWDATNVYEKTVATLNAQREGMADAESRVRNNWADNPDKLAIAKVMIDSVKNIFAEAMEKDPELSAALYKLVTGSLADAVKTDRDYYVSNALKGNRVVPDVPTAELKDMRNIIETLFNTCTILGSVPIDYPVEFSEANKGNRPKLSRKPYESRKASTKESIKRSFTWTVNGKVYNDSPAGMRSTLGVDKVNDVFDIFGLESRGQISNGKLHKGTVNGFEVTVICNIDKGEPEIDPEDLDDDNED